jgi:hypothetical protein
MMMMIKIGSTLQPSLIAFMRSLPWDTKTSFERSQNLFLKKTARVTTLDILLSVLW